MKTVKKTSLHVGDQVQVKVGQHKNVVGSILFIQKQKAVAILDTILPKIRNIKTSKSSQNEKKRIPILIATSNLMAWDGACSVTSRLGRLKELKKGGTIRYFKKTGNLITQKYE